MKNVVLLDVNQYRNMSKDFLVKSSNTKFIDNPSCGSRSVPSEEI